MSPTDSDPHKPQNAPDAPKPAELAPKLDAASTNDAANADAATHTAKARWYGPWGLFKLSVRTLVYVPLTLLVLLALAVGTSFGTRLVTLLAARFVPNFSATYVDGKLNDKVTLTDVAWSMEGIKVTGTRAHLAWQPACLLSKKLCVEALELDAVKVDIDTQALSADEPTETQTSTAPEPDFSQIELPFAIGLQKANINGVEVRVDDMVFAAKELAAAADWEQSLDIDYLNSTGLSVLIPAVKDAPEPETEQNTADDWPLASLPAVWLPMDIRLNSSTLTDSQLDIVGYKESISTLTLSGRMHGADIDVEQLSLRHTEGEVTLDGTLALKDDYPLDINLAVSTDSPDFFPELGKQQATLAAKGSMAKLAFTLDAKGSADLNLTGDIAPANQALPFNARLVLSRGGWPLTKPEYLAKDLTVTATGNLHSQRASLQGELSTPFHTPLNLAGNLSHEDSKLTLDELTARGDVGQVQLKGELDYRETLNWLADVRLIDFMPSKIMMPEGSTPLPQGSLSGTFTTSGTFSANGKGEPAKNSTAQNAGSTDSNATWGVTLSNTDISGMLDGYPISAKGKASINDKLHLSAESFELSLQGANLLLNGGAGTQWDLNGELKAPKLANFGAGFDGSVQAKLKVEGTQTAPKISISAQGNALAFNEVRLESLTLEGEYLPLTGHQFSLNTQASQVTSGENTLSSVTLKASGDLKSQRAELDSTGELSVNAKLTSEFNDKTQNLKANLAELLLTTPLGNWQLSEPMRLNWQLDKQQGSLSPSCLKHEFSSLCLVREATLGKRGEVAINYSGEPGKLIKKLMPENINWLGSANMDATVNWSPKAKATGVLNLNFSPGEFTLKQPRGQTVNLGYETLSLAATLTPKNLTAELKLLSKQLASLDSQINVAVTPDRTLSGNIDLDRFNLAALKEFLPQLETLQGIITSSLQLGGSLDKPDLAGNLQLTEGAVAASNNPTLMNDINLSMNFAGEKAKLTGGWLMGDGKGGINGSFSWPDGKFSGKLDIQGYKLAVIVPQLALLDVSPDVQLTFNPKQVDIRGNVSIPTGNVKIVQLAEGGVAVSSDVVFDDSIAKAQQVSSPYGITADLNIKVGNELKIEGMGLSGKLDGTLRLQQQAFKPPLLFGEIKVINGTYKFMGQTLQIPRGEVQFVGPPQLPNLNIEAVREIKDEDMVAGVRITGTASAPQVNLFSNPPKEQAEILSYILKGKGMQANGNGDNNAMMLSAALSLSSSLSGGAINSIGSTATSLIETFGFSNVQLDTNDDGKVAISGFIGEHLMVKYGVGVFNPGYEMTVRYYLLSQLYLESVSSALGQSLDIYYNFDLD